MGEGPLGSDERGLVDLPPLPGVAIGKRLRLLEQDGRRAVFMGATALHLYDVTDKAAEAATIAMLARTDAATNVEIAAAFGYHRNWVGRLAGRLERGGMAAVVPAKPGPKGAHKVTPEVLAIIDDASGLSIAEVTRRIVESTAVRLSEVHVRRLMLRRQARQETLRLVEAAEVVEASSPEIAAEATAVEQEETIEPPATLPAEASGRYMGAALYFPALAATGLLDAARECFRLPRSLRFGVREVMLTLFFLSLLRKPTVESAKHLRRQEFGALIGADRAPAVKTLRRKLAELVRQARASDFGEMLTRRWVDQGLVATAYLYVDGHMKVYTGKRKLAEVYNAQRRMPLAGLLTYSVGDPQGRPLLFVTEEASSSLVKAMPRVVAVIRKAVGEQPFTVIFDRGGYNGDLFSWLTREHIPFITYQRGTPNLPKASFNRHECRFEGQRLRWWIAEDRVKVAGSGPWRRIVARAGDAHQTPILTSIPDDVGPARIASLMFARCRQENFFRYMGEHHGLDELVSYAWDAVDADKTIPNPERKRLTKEIAARRAQLAELRGKLGDALLQEPRTASRSAHGLKSAQGGVVGQVRVLETEIADLQATNRALPKVISLREAKVRREALCLEQKAIVDRIKITAYNAEEWLLDRLVKHYPNSHDVRDLLRSFAELSGELRTTSDGVVIALDPPDTPQHRRALEGLCQDLSAAVATFPGSGLPVTYQVKMHRARIAA